MDRSKDNLSLPLRISVWLSRVVVGLTFVISGWAKSVDPWGFIYKIEEYFNVWNLVIPREITLSLAIALSVVEFVIGVMLTLGVMRRLSSWLAAAFMVVLLPLTVYIAVADPVSDCGCFGDFIVISNTATMVKNIILTALIIFLMIYNDRQAGLYSPAIQWLVISGATVYAGILNFVGYRYQPVVDFRPYPIGSELSSASAVEADGGEDGVFIYEKNGEEKPFSVDELPDSTWTFVRAEFEEMASENLMTVFDEDEDITAELFDGVGDQLILAVVDPGVHYLTRSRFANELYDYVSSHDGDMFALVAAEGYELEDWKQLALPEYRSYSAEDTSLKELVRGDAGLVYVHDGKIVWKRNLASVSYDAVKTAIQRESDLLNNDMNLNLGKINKILTIAFIAWLLFIFSLNYPGKILTRYLSRHSVKN